MQRKCALVKVNWSRVSGLAPRGRVPVRPNIRFGITIGWRIQPMCFLILDLRAPRSPSVERRQWLPQIIVGIVQMLHEQANVLRYVWHTILTPEGRQSDLFVPFRVRLDLIHDEG
jgi:hypothetical protein